MMDTSPSSARLVPSGPAPSSFFALLEAAAALPTTGPFLGVAAEAAWWGTWGEIHLREPRLLAEGPAGALRPVTLSSCAAHGVDPRVLSAYATMVEATLSVPTQPIFDFGCSSEHNGTDPRMLWILPDVAIFLDTVQEPVDLLSVEDIFPRCGVYHRHPTSAHDALRVQRHLADALDRVDRIARAHVHAHQARRAARG